MTTRAHQTLTVGAIIILLAAIAGLSKCRTQVPQSPDNLTSTPADDDSSDDDDSGRFDHLPEAPKE